MDFLELAKNRYSVREFSGKKVEKEKILKNIFWRMYGLILFEALFYRKMISKSAR